jgi:protein TonB
VQQASPLAPHATHMPIVQRVLDAVQVVGPPPPPPDRPPAPPPAPVEATMPQQISPTAPQVVPVPSWHEPLVQVPAMPVEPLVAMQADPLAWQRF